MIYLTGDTHIPHDIQKLSSKNFPEQRKLTNNDYVIICGDFGGVWNNSAEELYWRKWLNSKAFTTLFIDGNHENFELLNSFETIDFCGGKAHRISESIYHLMRGQIYNLKGKKVFTFGGAKSHDKQYRTEGRNWWKEELPSAEEIAAAYSVLESVDYNVDYVITHCAPNSVKNKLSVDFETDILTDFFEDILAKLSFDKWYFGHYHIDKALKPEFRCLYYDIIEMGKI